MNAVRAGSIVLLHDGGSHAPTIAALPCMFDYLRRQGFSVVALADLLSGNTSPGSASMGEPVATAGEQYDRCTPVGGSRCAAAQNALIRGGIHVAGGATGAFSIGTYYAVRTFQRFQGLPVTGVVDPATAMPWGSSPHRRRNRRGRTWLSTPGAFP